MDPKLSSAEMNRLVDSLFAVFTFVAGADGEIDSAEGQRFLQMMEAAQSSSDPMLGEVVRLALASSVGRMRARDNTLLSTEKTVSDAVAIADKHFEPADARRFKVGLYNIGKQLAAASGGGPTGLGDRTSEEERAALQKLAELLDVVIED